MTTRFGRSMLAQGKWDGPMPGAASPPRIIRFGDYEVDLAAGRLLKRGVNIRLRGQSFEILAVLLEHPGEVVTRDELRRRLWPEDVFVDFDNNLNSAIARLREALNDSAEHPRFIETLPKRGYRFVASLSEPSAPKPGLLVLPFANLSGDPTQEYFSDGMTEEIINELGCLAPEHLAVIARTTAMHYKGSHKDVALISRELGVDYVVEGSVRRADDRIAVNVQLIQASDQALLFANKYDAELHEIFRIESAVAQAIAEQVGITPWPSTRKPPRDFQAYNLYIQGRYHMVKVTQEAMARAKRQFEEAIARDPEFALAYDALAELYWYLGFVGLVPPKEALAAGMPYALRAVEIDNTLAETHALLAQYRKLLDYNWPEVQKELARALELNPASPIVRLRYAANGLMPHGRVKEAILELERALELDPLSMYTLAWLGVMLVLGHQWDRAIDQARVLLELHPSAYWGHLVLGVAYREKRMFRESIAAHRRAVELSGGSPLMLGWLGLALAKSGNVEEAQALLERLHEIAAKAYVPPTSFAWIHIGLGEMDSAFEWMDRAIDTRDDMIMAIKNYAFFDPIRSDPRYLVLLRKMNLEP